MREQVRLEVAVAVAVGKSTPEQVHLRASVAMGMSTFIAMLKVEIAMYAPLNNHNPRLELHVI